MKIPAVLIFIVFFAGAKAQSESCHNDKEVLTCRCFPNEDLDLFYETDDTITSLNVLFCGSTNLTAFMGPQLDETITSIRIENITNRVEFCPSLKAQNLEKIVFLNVGYLAEFTSWCTFHEFIGLDYFHIENTVIGKFDQIFTGTEVKKVILKNVTISDLQGLEFSFPMNGIELQIIDSYINVTKKISLILQTFDNIKIANTTFNFNRGGNISISGKHIHLKNNIFLKVSVDVTGEHVIHLTDTCAEGHGSAMRVRITDQAHGPIVHHGNRVPTEIIYIPKIQDHDDYICPGAKCDCSPTSRPEITKIPKNYGKTIHQVGTGRGFFICFIIIASGILARI